MILSGYGIIPVGVPGMVRQLKQIGQYDARNVPETLCDWFILTDTKKNRHLRGLAAFFPCPVFCNVPSVRLSYGLCVCGMLRCIFLCMLASLHLSYSDSIFPISVPNQLKLVLLPSNSTDRSSGQNLQISQRNV